MITGANLQTAELLVLPAEKALHFNPGFTGAQRPACCLPRAAVIDRLSAPFPSPQTQYPKAPMRNSETQYMYIFQSTIKQTEDMMALSIRKKYKRFDYQFREKIKFRYIKL